MPDPTGASPALAGVTFPESAPGVRSSTALAQAVLSEAATGAPDLAAAIRTETHWRKAYIRHFVELERYYTVQAAAGPISAQAALAFLHARFEYLRNGELCSLADAAALTPRLHFGRRQVQGTAPFVLRPLAMPYRAEILEGDALRRQLDEWVGRGVVEPSFAEALKSVLSHPEWLDLRHRRFVLLGAGAEIGPLHFLLDHGATVIAVDLDRTAIWTRLLDAVQATPGTLIAPARIQETAEPPDPATLGANLLTEIPEILTWLQPFEGPLTVGAYAYLDGADHVRVALAMDLIMSHLAAARTDLMLAYLATPTDAFAVPEATARAAMSAYAARSPAGAIQAPLRWMSRGRLFEPNVRELIASDNGHSYGVVDGLVAEQGPNYALAKRIQKWRALAARAAGVPISANVAPPSRTQSVMKNRLFAAAYAGVDRLGGEAFAPATCNALMGAKLVYDLRCGEAPANPVVPLEHPLALFMEGANHGGIWCNPYQVRSLLPAAAALGWPATLG